MRFYLQLFWVFFKIGAFTFGGGYAMIPLIQREVVNKRKWLEEGEQEGHPVEGQAVSINLNY